ncbi:hypothetical protein Q428_05930 [Fervidicella metallireducens AeB]|uniref:N-acetyltransferase domain-containing protein n=1 Tax=Fervidicella metallireducens AeB TaxID=1403537 RepID=A0A017RXW3_9CLOT|nr:GNAT family N-acetyltransferase [Fervidicella metallireducens]EYE88785.1 hypothetical protein Q428_05930 [Fervidicella metallireducens AeB]
MELVIREYKIGDEYKITELFKQVFHKEMQLEYWNWRYNKFKEKYINLMWNDEDLAGHYATFPIDLYINNRAVRTGFSMTTMTSNKYKNMGIFKKLARDLYEKNYNILNLIWGFPNNNSLHGFVKYLDWQHISDVNALSKNIFKKYSDVDNNISAISMFGKEYDDFFRKVILKRNYGIIVDRTSKYLNWRYVSNPTNKYYILEYKKDEKLLGYCVYKMYSELDKLTGDIVDILCYDDFVFEELIKKVINEIIDKKGVSVETWINDNLFVSKLLKLGFNYNDKISHFGFKINSDSINAEFLGNISNWYITMGDSDVY